jgi:TATA-box binding protein (TBP) (component of TFIID and TFIIIB)
MYTGVQQHMINNYVCTARFVPEVPNLHALARVTGGEHHRDRRVCLGFPEYNAYLIVNAASGIVNIAGPRTVECAEMACQAYIAAARQTGVELRKQYLRVSNVQSTFKLGEVDTTALARRYPGQSQRESVINRHCIYFKDPQVAICVFPWDGAVVMMGSTNAASAMENAAMVGRVLAPFVVHRWVPLPPSTKGSAKRRSTRRSIRGRHPVDPVPEDALPTLDNMTSRVARCVGLGGLEELMDGMDLLE